jgi:hypothetical protein
LRVVVVTLVAFFVGQQSFRANFLIRLIVIIIRMTVFLSINIIIIIIITSFYFLFIITI